MSDFMSSLLNGDNDEPDTQETDEEVALTKPSLTLPSFNDNDSDDDDDWDDDDEEDDEDSDDPGDAESDVDDDDEEVEEYRDEDGNLLTPEEVAQYLAEGAEITDDVEDDIEDDEEDVPLEDELTEEELDAEYDRRPSGDGLGDYGLSEETVKNSTEAQASDATSILDIDANSYELRNEVISLDSVVISKPVKDSRKTSHTGLTRSVAELGILTPIHVLVTEEYKEWLTEDKDERPRVFGGTKFILLDGLRRLYGGVRNRVETCNAVVWDFNDPEYGASIALVLRSILNNKQKQTWQELWGYYQVLEEVATINPTTMEYLLGLESGEAMKLKDVILAEYDEPKQDLFDKKKTLDQAYSALQKLRKEEDRAALDDQRGIGDVENAEDMLDGSEWIDQISEDDAKEALELMEDDELLFGGDNPEEDMLGVGEGELQSTSERKPLDPVLRNAILRRDNFTCQACGLGEGISSGIALGAFEIHHTVSVMAQLEGSRDDTGMIFEGSDMPKLITLCSTDHKLVHLIVIHGGKLGISKEEFEALDQSQQEKWKKLAKFAKVLMWAEKKSGKTMKRTEHVKLPENTPFWELDKLNKDAIALGEQYEANKDRGVI